jgi:hypothetical protein
MPGTLGICRGPTVTLSNRIHPPQSTTSLSDVDLLGELGADSLPSWVRTPAQTTDGHLVALAAARNARLATLDEAIPDAARVP